MVSNRNLCGAAKTLHGRETRAILAKRQQALAGLKLIKRMGKRVGVVGRGEVRKLITRGCYGISYRMEPDLSVSDGFGY